MFETGGTVALLQLQIRFFSLCMTPRVSLPTCCFVQIADLLAELADERSTSESASQLLETETSERLRLEKDLKELQAHIHADIKNTLGWWT